ncbi:hypothetical protein C791_6095 [Amycolatopsis azurea DSM 43854]|uniref:Uncharacterized protein n=1 Tax=Amycolatopsis azurea DSM 43854 TaxID=1238180 RepID=M2QSV4_9PSEU|nr:hypothetical protein C791_6095 [Amycolatopsis azurea DSM 43854]
MGAPGTADESGRPAAAIAGPSASARRRARSPEQSNIELTPPPW